MAVTGIGEGHYQVLRIGSEDKKQEFFSSGKIDEKEFTIELKKSDSFKEIYWIKSELYNSLRKENFKDLMENISEKPLHVKKVFPPYPPLDEDRIKALTSFSAFRALIERLTIPPEQKEEITRLSAETAEIKSLQIRHYLSKEKNSITGEMIFLKEF
ncbi:MAG: hypothetical protein N2257_01745 [Thermodesulfovibrionales bacterium]|nr:hypothetical protein [Thermodesulfovibrionales bacterium]